MGLTRSSWVGGPGVLSPAALGSRFPFLSSSQAQPGHLHASTCTPAFLYQKDFHSGHHKDCQFGLQQALVTNLEQMMSSRPPDTPRSGTAPGGMVRPLCGPGGPTTVCPDGGLSLLQRSPTRVPPASLHRLWAPGGAPSPRGCAKPRHHTGITCVWLGISPNACPVPCRRSRCGRDAPEVPAGPFAPEEPSESPPTAHTAGGSGTLISRRKRAFSAASGTAQALQLTGSSVPTKPWLEVPRTHWSLRKEGGRRGGRPRPAAPCCQGMRSPLYCRAPLLGDGLPLPHLGRRVRGWAFQGQRAERGVGKAGRPRALVRTQVLIPWALPY